METVALDSKFWRGKKVLLTGHTGFKGSWLSLWLEKLGAHVTGYALPPPTRPSLFELAQIDAGLQSVIGDIRDLPKLKEAMQTGVPEIILHLAAQSLVHESYASPVETFATNVMGTVNVLEAARACASVRAIVIVTSDKCYQNRERQRPYREVDPMGGHDPYSASKGAAELATAAYRSSFFSAKAGGARSAVATARAGNVIGGGDWAADRLIPDIVRAARRGEAALIRHPRAIRPWQHVLEPLYGYMLLAEKLYQAGDHYAAAWNFGPSEQECRSVEWLATRFLEIWDEGPAWEQSDAGRLHEAGILKLDSSKAHELLGWHPRLKIEDAIDWTATWYKQWTKSANMRAVTLSQIERFERIEA